MRCMLPQTPIESNKHIKGFIGGVAMPRGDRTGPLGLGPMTGRGAGFCKGFRAPGALNYLSQRGFNRGRGYRAMLCAAGLISGCVYLAYQWVNRGKIK